MRVPTWARLRRRLAAVPTLAPLGVFLVALAPRLWFVGEHPLDLYLVSNMAFLDARAHDLLSGSSTIGDTFTPVGYPALIALAHAVSERGYALVGYAQALLGAATAALAHALARRLTRSDAAALVVGLVVALYLPLVVYTGFLLTETTFAFLVALFAWLLLRAWDRPGIGRAALAGLVFGVAAAVRPNLLLAAPLLALHGLLLRRRAAPRAWLAPLGALAFALPVLVAVVAHNSRIAGRPTGLATNGGVNFLLGHCECRAITFPPGGGIGLVSGHQNRQRYTEVIASPRFAFDEAYYYREAASLLRAHPERALHAFLNVSDGLVLTGLGEPPAHPYYPGWMGHEEELRAFGRGFAWLAVVPALVHAALSVLRRSSRGLRSSADPTRGVLLALVGSAIATLYLFLGDPRLRVPFDPLIAVLAVDAWWCFARAARARLLRGHRHPTSDGETADAPS
jgi:4-amino-4-deoxy-L-arabinose transferase-like glycosyltransferase